MKKTAIILGLSAGIFACHPTYGSDFQDLISGKDVPLTIQLKQLDDSWREVAISGQFEMGDYLKTWANLFGTQLYTNVYYTQGQTVTVAGETYAIAYRLSPQGEGVSFKNLMETMLTAGCSESSLPQKLTPETNLTLSFLNLRTIGSLNDVRAFNLESTLADSEAAYEKIKAECEQGQVDSVNSQVSSNLTELGAALLYYISQNDGILPKMDNPETVETVLIDWVSDPSVFVHPETQIPYQPNSSLSGKTLAEISNADQVVAFYEAESAPDGSRWVVFLDGSVKQIAEADWAKVQQTSEIP